MTITSPKNPILFLCILLTPLIGLGLDLYTPSLPAIAIAFHASHQAVKLTLLTYVAAFGVAQMITGPISDRIGRKVFVWIALIIYFFASTGAAFSPNIETLYFFRIFQAIGAAIFSAVMKAMLIDSFSGKALAKANTFFGFSWSLTPIIAPAVGGYLQHLFNWQANFCFMAFYSFICMFFCYFLLVETLPKHKIKNNQLAWFQKWKILLSDMVFISGAILLSIQVVILMLYYITAPFVIQTQLHYNAARYGEIMLLIGASYLLGNIVNGRLLNHFHITQLILFGLIGSLITTLVMIIITHAALPNIYLTTVPIFCLFFWDGLIFSNLLTRCLSQHREFAGTAGALLGGLLNILTAGISTFFSHFWDLHHLFTLSCIYFALILFALTLFTLLFRHD